jgi:hypothetical protein
MDIPPLTPAEALALLDPQQPQNRLALKLTLKDLVARRVLRVEQRPRAGGKTETYLFAGPAPAANLPPHAQVVHDLIAQTRAMEGGVATMTYVAKTARTRFGPDLSGFGKNYVLPALVARGLLEVRQEKVLWLFPVTRIRHTPAGEQAKRELEATLERARALPASSPTTRFRPPGPPPRWAAPSCSWTDFSPITARSPRRAASSSRLPARPAVAATSAPHHG